MPKQQGPVVLCILDGFGIAPDSKGNGVTRAGMPNFNHCIRTYPTMTLKASGLVVGLPRSEMGNSEVGHLNIGTGRVFYQNRQRIDHAVERGEFHANEAFQRTVKHVRERGSQLHLIGLVSTGGVHSHQEHCHALIEFAKKQKVKEVYIHAMLDGRDAIYNSGVKFIDRLEKFCKQQGVGKIATISGRYFGMDRDKRWDREERAYRAMVEGVGETATHAKEAIVASYEKKIYDEEFPPTVMVKGDSPIGRIQDGDGIIFFNFRADRARQLTRAFVDPKFKGFERTQLKDIHFAAMMEYEKGLDVDIAFPPEEIPTSLGQEWSDRKLKQLHIAETEKYMHVTFFFNGMREEELPNEHRILIPSPKVASYDTQPEMSAPKICSSLVKEIRDGLFDCAVVNFANADMVGHTGAIDATVSANATVDKCLGEVLAAMNERNGTLIVTADHGNAEELLNLKTGEIDKEHSTNPVPFILCGTKYVDQPSAELKAVDWDLSLLQPVGMLADIAPTVLGIMGIPQPSGMSGQSLL
ncbi:MAG: 2,3-bisphosphoglycerate-independent phosphoglycerate mutase [Candidatus Uhrbacteria bacterium]